MTDTSNKALRNNAPFHTGQAAPEDKHNELHFMVTKKISAIPPAKFVQIFLGTAESDSNGVDQTPGAPLPNPTINPFANLPEARVEKDMYAKIIRVEALTNSGLCPDHVFAATPHKGDTSEGSGRAIDLSMYPRHPPPNLGTADEGKFLRTNWLTIKVGIECKMNGTAHNPFNETHNGDEPNAISHCKVLGQIPSYLELITQHQQQTFQYMVLFLGAFARILCVDQSGIFVTKKFKYRGEDGLILAGFFRNLGRASLARRGFDTTATRVSPSSAEGETMLQMKRDIAEDDYIKKMFSESLNEDWPWWKLEVPDETAMKNAPAGPAVATGKCGLSKTRSYLVGKPYFQAPGVTSRFTHGYVALDVTNPKRPAQFVFLKDAWRVVSNGIEKEGTVLETLKENKVKFIPTVVCHGDITGQRSISQDHWPKYHKGKKCELKTHQHYRLVVKEVCKPLDQFEDSSELAMAMWCCLKAHSQAYSLGIIHRDISAGNILLYRREDGEWQGMLNDWEMSKTLAQQELEGRQPDRMGTWQFLSVNALDHPTKTIVIEDELESFFHVLLYMAIRLLHHNFEDRHVPQFLREYFDGYIPLITRNGCGALKRQVMLAGRILVWSDKDENHMPPKKLLFINPSTENAITEGHNGKHKSGSSSLRLAAEANQSPENDRPSQQLEGDREPSASPSAIAPAPDYNHPLNDIFATLLSWFKAYHILQESDGGEPAVKRDVQPRPIKKSTRRIQALDEDESDSELDPASARSRAPAESHAALEEIAQNLRSHRPILQLFKDAVNTASWPVGDRYPDRKPDKHWKPAGDLVPKKSTLAMSTKRPASAVDDLEPPSTPPKRSRA